MFDETPTYNLEPVFEKKPLNYVIDEKNAAKNQSKRLNMLN